MVKLAIFRLCSPLQPWPWSWPASASWRTSSDGWPLWSCLFSSLDSHYMPKYHIFMFHNKLPPQRFQFSVWVMSCSWKLLTGRTAHTDEVKQGSNHWWQTMLLLFLRNMGRVIQSTLARYVPGTCESLWKLEGNLMAPSPWMKVTPGKDTVRSFE